MSTPLTSTDTDSDIAFDARHEKELSAKRFVGVRAAEIFIPLGATAAGGAIGYFALGKPLKSLFPKAFGGINHLDDFRKGLRKLKGADLDNAFATIRSQIAPEVMTRLQKERPGFKVENLDTAITALKEVGNKDIIAIKESLNIAHNAGAGMERWVGAAALGMVGSIIGSVFVGYQKWRKEESARLAASEIDRDISQLEVFSKRDPELVAENKRLRAMLAETAPVETHAKHAPKHHVSMAEHEGTVSHQQQMEKA